MAGQKNRGKGAGAEVSKLWRKKSGQCRINSIGSKLFGSDPFVLGFVDATGMGGEERILTSFSQRSRERKYDPSLHSFYISGNQFLISTPITNRTA